MVWKAAGTIAIATAVGLIVHPALAQNGRPPPIKLGSPAAKPAGISGNDANTTKQIYDAVLKMPLKPEFTDWSAGQPLKLLNPVATHICLLTGVSGNFAGAGERVVVGIDKGAAGGERWYISGSSGQAQLRATATCVAKEKFVPYVPGMTPTYELGSYKLPHHMNGACGSQVAANGWKARNYAHFISEVAGKWRGGGEKLAVVEGAQGYGAIQVNGCSGFVDGALTAVGSNSYLAKYWTANGNTGTAANATFAKFTQNDEATFFGGAPFITAVDGSRLAPVDSAICGIVYLSGRMQGYGESVDIKPELVQGKMHWVLRMQNIAAGGYLSAAVRCFARDQR